MKASTPATKQNGMITASTIAMATDAEVDDSAGGEDVVVMFDVVNATPHTQVELLLLLLLLEVPLEVHKVWSNWDWRESY